MRREKAGRGLSFRAASSFVLKRGRAAPAQDGGAVADREGASGRPSAGIEEKRGRNILLGRRRMAKHLRAVPGSGRDAAHPAQGGERRWRRASPHEAGESRAGIIFSGGFILRAETVKGRTTCRGVVFGCLCGGFPEDLRSIGMLEAGSIKDRRGGKRGGAINFWAGIGAGR